MNILNLRVYRIWFDEIKSGVKDKETRQIRPDLAWRYLETDESGQEKKDSQGNPIPIQYDAICFHCGGDEVTVEVTDACVLTEDDERLIVYSLGKIVDKDRP